MTGKYQGNHISEMTLEIEFATLIKTQDFSQDFHFHFFFLGGEGTISFYANFKTPLVPDAINMAF